MVNVGGQLAKAAILIHPGNRPSDFLGCIGVGFYNGDGTRLEGSGDLRSGICMDVLFDLCGGFEVGKVVFLEVNGEIPN